MHPYSVPQNKYLKIASYFIVAVIFFGFGWQFTNFLNNEPNVKNENTGMLLGESEIKEAVNLDLFWETWALVDKEFYDEEALDKEVMTYGAIKGMVSSIGDDYTAFMDPEETRQFDDNLEGLLEGIGAQLSMEDSKLTIVTPLKDSPAEKAGLLPNDVIYKIGDKFAAEYDLYDAIMAIRGEEGTTVTLTILRQDVEEPFEVSIVRDSIDLNSVTVEKMDGDIAYLSVNQFNNKTLDEFNKAISELILTPPKGLIIDLRYNGGGYLDSAVELLSFLLPKESVAVKIRYRGGKEETQYTNGNPKLTNVPLVILVNEGSASASEIMAGAIQDHERGIVVGTKTFGKGTVQAVENFDDGSSMRITIAQWLTPDGKNVNKTGLTPDIVKEISEQDIENQFDSQKEAAAEYLRNLKE